MAEKESGGAKFVKKAFFFLQKSTAVPNEIIFNQDLSDAAKLLLMALEAFPESNWEIYQGYVAKMLGFGRDKIQKAMSDLIKLGYMRRTQKKCEKNRFLHYEYEFYWKPVFKDGAEPKPEDPPKYEEESELPATVLSGNGVSGNGKPDTSRSIDSSLYIIPNTNSIIEPPTPEPQKQEKSSVGGFPKEVKIYQCLQKVDIQDKDKIRLCKQFDEMTVSKAVAHCSKPGFKIQTSLDSSIFYFCKNPDHIVKTKEEIQADKIKLEDQKREKEMQRRYLGRDLLKFLWTKARELGVYLHDNQDYMEISNDRIKDKVYYSNDKFEALVAHLLKKVGLEIPPMLKGFA